VTGALEGVRVLDLTTGLAGAYATKLLCDAGADVVTVEGAGGHPLRRWTASGQDLPPGADGALWRWLAGGRRSVPAPGDLRAGADIVLVEDDAAGPGSVVVSLSDFGLSGPWAGRPASDLTLQAESGSIGSRGVPELPPVAAGGRLGEWTAGVYAAAAAVAALRTARASGAPERVEVSLFECMLVTLNMHEPLHAALAGSTAYTRWIQVPSVERAKDGWVCFSFVTGQQWLDFCALIGRPDLGADPGLGNMLGRWPRRAEVYAAMEPWLRERTVDEVVDLAAAFRLPVAHVTDGATVAEMAHFLERGVFDRSPYGGYPQPRPPFHATGMSFRQASAAPAVGADDVVWEPRPLASVREPQRPLVGTRIVDLTAFWAGPSGTGYLTALGADVVKVESVQRPDGIRFAGGQINTDDGWWDRSWVFQAANAGKQGITLDLGSERGRELLHRLLADADVVLENFSPRVMEQFGLSYDALAARYPRLVVVRMPAYGLDGPWVDRVGFALTMEALAGMATITGHPEGRPTCPGGVLDPIAGMHAAFATLLALEARERTGSGQLVEVPMIECALNVAAEPLLEHGAYGAVLERQGNRGVGVRLQDVYRCAGEDAWVAVTVRDEAEETALRSLAGEDLAGFFAGADAASVVERLVAAGVPAGVVRLPTVADRNPQLEARGFFEAHEHPTLGEVRYPVLPTRFASWSGPVHRAPAPTLGQHNAAVLGAVGVSEAELAELRAQAVIGDRPKGL
jgi:crotonobetainyl-CoA:carnitine CoA-transferase CaiB-like acyl-CoA transferase